MRLHQDVPCVFHFSFLMAYAALVWTSLLLPIRSWLRESTAIGSPILPKVWAAFALMVELLSLRARIRGRTAGIPIFTRDLWLPSITSESLSFKACTRDCTTRVLLYFPRADAALVRTVLFWSLNASISKSKARVSLSLLMASTACDRLSQFLSFNA